MALMYHVRRARETAPLRWRLNHEGLRPGDERSSKWHEWIADPTLADAILDRIVHNACKLDLKGRIDTLLRKAHGKKTEKMPRPKDAIRKADKTTPDKKRSDERRAAHAAARAELPTEIEHHAVPVEQRSCPHCESGGSVRPVGQGRSTVEIDYVPGYFRRRVHLLEHGYLQASHNCAENALRVVAPRWSSERRELRPKLNDRAQFT